MMTNFGYSRAGAESAADRIAPIKRGTGVSQFKHGDLVKVTTLDGHEYHGTLQNMNPKTDRMITIGTKTSGPGQAGTFHSIERSEIDKVTKSDDRMATAFAQHTLAWNGAPTHLQHEPPKIGQLKPAGEPVATSSGSGHVAKPVAAKPITTRDRQYQTLLTMSLAGHSVPEIAKKIGVSKEWVRSAFTKPEYHRWLNTNVGK